MLSALLDLAFVALFCLSAAGLGLVWVIVGNISGIRDGVIGVEPRATPIRSVSLASSAASPAGDTSTGPCWVSPDKMSPVARTQSAPYTAADPLRTASSPGLGD